MMRRFPTVNAATVNAAEALAAEAACSRAAALVAVRLGAGALTGRAFIEHVEAAAARAGISLGGRR